MFVNEMDYILCLFCSHDGGFLIFALLASKKGEDDPALDTLTGLNDRRMTS